MLALIGRLICTHDLCDVVPCMPLLIDGPVVFQTSRKLIRFAETLSDVVLEVILATSLSDKLSPNSFQDTAQLAIQLTR